MHAGPLTVCFIAGGLAMVEMNNQQGQQVQTETVEPMEQTGKITQQEGVYTTV